MGASPFVRTQEGDVDPELTELTSRVATPVVTLLTTTADELRRVVAELHPLLSDAAPQFTTITMQVTTFDDSWVNQADRDLHVSTGE